MVNNLQLTVISMIGLLGEGNISYVSPAHSEIIHFFERKATGMFSEIIKPQ